MNKMKIKCLAPIWAVLLACGFPLARAGEVVPIVLNQPLASQPERKAAEELALYLGKIYGPGVTFSTTDQLPGRGPAIVVGTPANLGELKKAIPAGAIEHPGAILVTVARESGRQVGIITGSDGRAVLNAAYALIEKLGYRFYMSVDGVEDMVKGPFDFARWQIKDWPLSKERIAMQWPNFTASFSTVPKQELIHWVKQLRRMRYTTALVHWYAYQPIQEVTYNGVRRPMRRLTSSKWGADWGQGFVNDVRLLIGGELFQSDIFGSEISILPTIDQQVAKARETWREVVAVAKEFDLDLQFARDFDTVEAFGPVLNTFSPTDRFGKNGWCIRPDTEAGYPFYKTQIAQFVKDYPDLKAMNVWFRSHAPEIAPADLPAAWQADFQAKAAQYHLTTNTFAAGAYGIGKIIEGVRRALDELGRKDIEVHTGTWGDWNTPRTEAVGYLAPAYARLYSITHLDPKVVKACQTVGRPWCEMTWMQTDGGMNTYGWTGRPKPVPENLGNRVEQDACMGYGLFHWFIRPGDIVFKNLIDQTWASTKDYSLRQSCFDFAQAVHGARWRESMGERWSRFFTDAPPLGTSCGGYHDMCADYQFDRWGGLQPPEQIQAALDKVDDLSRFIAELDPAGMSASARNWYNYLHEYVEYIRQYGLAAKGLVQGVLAVKAGDLPKAAEHLREDHARAALEHFAAAVRAIGPDAGDLGFLADWNIRWYGGHMMIFRERIGLEPTRIKLGPKTDPEGSWIYIDREGGWWRYDAPYCDRDWSGWAAKELPGFVPQTADEEICQSYMTSPKDMTLILSSDAKTWKTSMSTGYYPGVYNVELYFPAALVTQANERVVTIQLETGEAQRSDTIDLHVPGGRVLKRTFPIEIRNGNLNLTVKGRKGDPVLSGVKITAADPTIFEKKGS